MEELVNLDNKICKYLHRELELRQGDARGCGSTSRSNNIVVCCHYLMFLLHAKCCQYKMDTIRTFQTSLCIRGDYNVSDFSKY
jgi:hypothetical protein